MKDSKSPHKTQRDKVGSIEDYYNQLISKDPQRSVAIATLKTLMMVLEQDKSTTVVGLRENVRGAIDRLKQIESCVQVESVSEIFLRFITLYVSRYDSFEALKKALSNRSELFLKNGVISAKEGVAMLASRFIAKNTKILMHSKSMTVLACLKNAHKDNKNMFVYVTESRPDSSGREMCNLLTKAGIQNQLVVDASIGIYLEKVDMVMVGAEGVCASGGILNKVGTYPLAICARAINKPFYVVAESYKFIRMYPLNQNDVPLCTSQHQQKCPSDLPNDKLDYTPPAYITLILTDLGPLTTAAISDELMKIYI
jgi:translation initiation factor eIF-2B subunit alpha